jgi:hypothetical protein
MTLGEQRRKALDAKRAAFADQRHGEGGTMSVPDRQLPPEREFVAGALEVGDLDRLQVADGAAGHGGAVERHHFSDRKPLGLAE